MSLSLARFLLLFALLPTFASAAPVTSDFFTFSVQTQNPDAFAQVRETADDILTDLGTRLGALEQVTAEPKIAVTLTSNREAFREAQSSMSAVDHWAAGTAYPAQGKIFLSIDPHDFFSKEDIAVHEIAHIAVYRAAGKRRLPRWFEEGLAIYLAGEELVTRVETATAAMVFKELPPLSTYERRFPKASGEASWLLGWLSFVHTSQAWVEKTMPILFDALRRGQTFNVASNVHWVVPSKRWRLNGSSYGWNHHVDRSLSDGEIIWGFRHFCSCSFAGLHLDARGCCAAMPLDIGEAEDDSWLLECGCPGFLFMC